MKKNIIILTTLALFLTINTANAISFDGIVSSAQEFLSKEVKVPDFSLTDTNGNIHTDESTKGKYLVVNFWATWCPPCLKEIPVFVEFYDKYKHKVEILGLDYEDASIDKITEFSDTFLINYPIIMFEGKNSLQFTNFGQIIGMPTTYIYNPKGKLVDLHMGKISTKTLEAIISK